MFKIFWILVWCNFFSFVLLLAESVEDPDQFDVVIKRARQNRLESLLLAHQWTVHRLKELTFVQPKIFLVNLEKETAINGQKISQIEQYTQRFPNEVALWRSQEMTLVSKKKEFRGFDSWSFNDLQEMIFTGDAHLEFGYGSARSTFESARMRLQGKRIFVEEAFVWKTNAWEIQGDSCEGELRNPEQLLEISEAESTEFPKFLQSVKVHGSPVVIEGEVTQENALKLKEISMTIEDHLDVSVIDEVIHFKTPNNFELVDPEMQVKGREARGRLSSAGWQWIEINDPHATFTQEALQSLSHLSSGPFSQNWQVKGNLLVLSEKGLVIEGDPVILWNDKLTLQASQMRRDAATGRYRFKDIRVQPKKQKKQTKETP